MKIKHLISCFSIAFLLTSCLNQPAKPYLNDENTSISIAYFSENHFEQRYSSLLSLTYPNLRYTIAPTNDLVKKELTVEDWTHIYSADLLYLHPTDYQLFSEKGLLLDLEAYVKRENFPLDQIVPGLPDTIRTYGDGFLYGLPSNYFTLLLVINKDMFDQMQIIYPEEPLDWEQLIALAGHFPRGLALPYSTPVDWIAAMGESLNLQIEDKLNDTTALGSSAWTQTMELAEKALEADVVRLYDSNEPFPFTQGEYAMALITYDELKQLEQQSDVDWQLAPLPIHHSAPTEGRLAQVHGIFAISQSSSQPEAAWELMNFFLSEEVAKWEYRGNHGFSTLKSMTALNQEGTNWEAMFRPVISTLVGSYTDSELLQLQQAWEIRQR